MGTQGRRLSPSTFSKGLKLMRLKDISAATAGQSQKSCLTLSCFAAIMARFPKLRVTKFLSLRTTKAVAFDSRHENFRQALRGARSSAKFCLDDAVALDGSELSDETWFLLLARCGGVVP